MYDVVSATPTGLNLKMLVPIPVTLWLILNFDSNTSISEWLGTSSFAKCDNVFI